ncbi:hypothetical protein FDK21_03250 [Cohaesibacter sp. CAU 1516]|uniref:hypothetical protein n=1 Tax=Cohaesibacter sp. CAU 1516 TaxID=2576038 RepID=UPI0010FEB9BA|nr:hypothetical protein [Cohaesibacter sp. CAU 1516]TLP48689.1 hypothetical protein FDK21_03250 [Cohaesibacter sp. CAU 1516]
MSYPRNFDADFLKGSTQLVNGNQTHWSKGDAFPNQTSKSSGCDKLFVRGDRFRVHCIRTAAYPDKEGGYVRSQWVEDARGVIRDGQLEGWYAMSDRTWSDGRNNIQDGLYGKGSEAGSVSGSLSANGVISLLMTKQSERHILNQMKVEEGFTYLTGNWKSYQVHPDARHLSYRATYQFDPSMASKPDPAITAETIQQEMEPPRQELVANDQPDGDDPDRKPVTLSGGNGTIALEDALKQQGIDDEQHPRTDSPTTEPIDQFDAWQQDFKDRGWRYSEKDGVAEFEPQEGARDEKGWVYSEEKGDFLPPPESERDIASIDDQNSGDMTQTRPPRDGDQNENGEVWSDEDGGWIGRNLYQQEKERRATIKRLDDQSHRGQSDDVRTLYDAWQTSKKQGKLQPKVLKEVADKKRALDGRIETLISGETDLHRIRFLRDMQDHLSDIDATDKDGVLGDWNRIVAKQEEDVAFKVDYTMKQFIVETGAMTLDTVLTRGAAMATLHTYNAALKEAGNPEGTTGSILWEGAKEGAYQGTVGFVLNKLAAGALTKAKAMRGAAKTVKGTADDVAVTTGKSNWNSSSDAIRTETQKKLLSKLPANHPARKIGNLNETLGKAGGQFDARKITPHMRLDPTSETYKAGIEALKKNPRYLTDKAKKVSDAVRHDLDLAAREQAVKQLYKDRPDLKGHLTHFENTGSHARKGMTYRGGASDIDFTPKGTATAQGKEAEVLFSRYYDKAVNKVSGGKLTMQDLKAHAYGGDKGTGAFQSKTGLNVKDVMNQTSGRIDKLDPSGKITHSLRGDDVVEVGKPTRLFEKGTTQSLAKKDVVRFRKDLANKFREELPEMATQQEKLIQAAKGYKLSRVIESKAIGGRSLAANRALYQWSKQVKNRIPTMTDRQMKAMTEKFLKGIEEGR